jgi:hypothetical protein
VIGSAEFRKAFEQYILMELKAYQAYRRPDLPIAFWRTAAGQEVDFILGDKEAAIEVKGSARVHEGDLRGLRALGEDGPVRKAMLVCLEDEPRKLAGGVTIVPWRRFLERLWAGEIA